MTASATKRENETPFSDGRIRWLLRGVFLTAGFIDAWNYRFVMNPDGTAYVDLARAYLSGDWSHAFSSYWSPLFPWLLSAGLAIFRPSVAWELPLVHAVVFVGLLLSLFAWEFLSREWEQWQGPPKDRTLTTLGSYAVLGWSALTLNGLLFTSADLFVFAAAAASAAVLIRFRRGAGRNADAVILGVLLAAGYFAKAAFEIFAVASLLVLAVSLPKWLDRRFLVCVTVMAVITAIFVIPMSHFAGHFTLGTAGKLNYSWEVTGTVVEGYKESGSKVVGQPGHPIPVLLNQPRVLSLADHPFGTFPLHADPSWWCDGYPSTFNLRQQTIVLTQNLIYSALLLLKCPGLWLLALAAWKVPLANLLTIARKWPAWLPAITLCASYTLVYVLPRYLAAPYGLIGFGFVATTWNVEWSAAQGRLARRVLQWGTLAVMYWALLVNPFLLFLTTGGFVPPARQGDVDVALFLKSRGISKSDKIAVIGSPFTTAWAGLIQAQIVGVIPAREWHDNSFRGRPLRVAFDRSDAFWRADATTKRRVFQIFQKLGARCIVARDVPTWADVSAWQVAGKSASEPTRRGTAYYLSLNDIW